MCAHAHKTQSETCTLHVTNKLTYTCKTFTSVQFSLFSLVLSSNKNCDKTKPSKSCQTQSEICTRHVSHKLTSTCKTIISHAQICTTHYVRWQHIIACEFVWHMSCALCQITTHYVQHIMCTNMHQTILCTYSMSTYVRTRQNATRAHSFTHSRAQKHTHTAAHEHTHTHMKYHIICAQMRTRQDRMRHMHTTCCTYDLHAHTRASPNEWIWMLRVPNYEFVYNTYECLVLHIWMRPVTRMIRMNTLESSIFTHTHEWCHTWRLHNCHLSNVTHMIHVRRRVHHEFLYRGIYYIYMHMGYRYRGTFYIYICIRM